MEVKQLINVGEILLEGTLSNNKLLGESIVKPAKRVAYWLKKNKPVLIVGYTGTGKSHVAEHAAVNFLKNDSSDGDARYREISCLDCPDTLFRSLLFGHKKGAFTGASADQKGLLAAVADEMKRSNRSEGILFLDEIGDLEPSSQAALLRLIQKHSYMRLGDTKETKVPDIRFIAATNKAGKVRKDLKARFKIVNIDPLRRRRQDIPIFVQSILKKLGVAKITPKALICLMNYSWKANFREIQTCLEELIADRDLEIEMKRDSSDVDDDRQEANLQINHKMLPPDIYSHFEDWIDSGCPCTKHPSPFQNNTAFDVNDSAFPTKGRQLYVNFAKHIGFPSVTDSRDFWDLCRTKKASLDIWHIRHSKKEEDEEELAPDTESDKKLLLLLKLMPNYEFRQIELLYWLSLIRTTGPLSLSAFARKANVSDKKANKAFADAKIDPTKNNSEDVILQKARSVQQHASLFANSTSMKAGRNA